MQCNLKIVNYLDVIFSLSNATYRPNNEITYINKESNHLPSILRQIPLSIESRLSKHSSNEKIFKESTQVYQEALKKSGYNHQLTYQESIKDKNGETKSRNRKKIWFNPPYSENVSAKVGNQFLKLISTLLDTTNFTSCSIKTTLSYSSMSNMKNIINTHNKKIINPPKDNIARTCNCIREHQLHEIGWPFS